MTAISILLAFKIGFTCLTVAIPFVVFSKPKLERLTASFVQTTTVFRLYGVSILSLLIVYSWGIWQAETNVMPWLVVSVGIFSNLAAPAVIMVTGAGKQQRLLGSIYGIIGIALVYFAMFPTVAMYKVL
jgi:hypothetical protein